MQKFTVTKENAPIIIQAFKTNYANAESIIRGQMPITNAEYRQLQADFAFNGLSHVFRKKERKKENFPEVKESA